MPIPVLPDASTPNVCLADAVLMARSRAFGASCLVARRRFLATLPEIERRGLIRDRYADLKEYAAVVGGVARHQVSDVLALHRRLQPFPQVWALYESGRVGSSVILRVPVELLAGDPQAWADRLSDLPKRAIEKLVDRELGRETSRPGEPAGASLRAATREGRDSSSAPVEPLPLPSPGRSTVGASPPEGAGSAGPASGAFTQNGLHSVLRPGSDDPAPGVEEPEDPVEGSADPSSAPLARLLTQILTTTQRARLEVLRRERSEAAGRKLALVVLIRDLVDEAYLDSRGPGQHSVAPDELAALTDAGVRAAERAASQAALPVAVERAVRVRAGGFCESGSCRDPGETYHHRIKAGARREKLPDELRSLPRHHPSAVHLLCGACHTLLHQGRFSNADEVPGGWILQPAGVPNLGDRVDRRFQARRSEARLDRLRMASACPGRGKLSRKGGSANAGEQDRPARVETMRAAPEVGPPPRSYSPVGSPSGSG